MPSAAPRKLTERQRAVIERIDRRVPIKVIAQELGVSETRINQHIRALKDIYEAASLNELVELYRATKADASAENSDPSGKGFRDSAYNKSQVPSASSDMENGPRVDEGELVMSDASALIQQAPWLKPGDPGEPRVVPGVLDGEHAILFRLAAIVGIGFGFLGALVLTLTAAVTISEALDGRASVPVDEEGYS